MLAWPDPIPSPEPTSPVYEKTPVSPAMDTCAQKTAHSASESLFYQENLFQRSYVPKQKSPCLNSA